MILAATGHRPDKLGGYDEVTFLQLANFAVTKLRETNPDEVIVGMAMGWDLAVGIAAIDMGIPITAAIPCLDHDARWTDYWRRITAIVRACAARECLVTDRPYELYMMQKRNRWMVDRCDEVLALWDGSFGGTANCVSYALERKKPVNNIWSDWRAYRSKHAILSKSLLT